jgi:hypothetical protein
MPQAIPLMPLMKQGNDPHENTIGFALRDYLEVIDWTGRVIRDDKRGAIASDTPPILQRIGLDTTRYLEHLRGQAPTEKPVMLGRIDQIRAAVRSLGRCFIKGIGEVQRLYRYTQTT